MRADFETSHTADKTNKLDGEGVHICAMGWYHNLPSFQCDGNLLVPT